MNIPADTLCQLGFCVAPALAFAHDPVSKVALPVCAWHRERLRLLRVALDEHARALAHQTWLGV